MEQRTCWKPYPAPISVLYTLYHSTHQTTFFCVCVRKNNNCIFFYSHILSGSPSPQGVPAPSTAFRALCSQHRLALPAWCFACFSRVARLSEDFTSSHMCLLSGPRSQTALAVSSSAFAKPSFTMASSKSHMSGEAARLAVTVGQRVPCHVNGCVLAFTGFGCCVDSFWKSRHLCAVPPFHDCIRKPRAHRRRLLLF